MSYDLYCFSVKSDPPHLGEARAFLDSQEAGEAPETDTARALKRRIADALLACNPRLQEFKIDYATIARTQKISEEEARVKFTHIELDPPEGDAAVQIIMYNDHVAINMPYWYTGADADVAFKLVNEYLRVIRKEAGYFAFDPQTDRIFDPERETIGDHSHYERIAKDLPGIIARGLKREEKKAWWRFW